ncbi:hypothetical protein IQ22_02877 [Pseudomonas duriflava]|uniref:Uncharacterized protein n=1 Tax=Pseudomonas duriflava TaxID=459528 RepID=A0A562Q8J6_9PSED|nr:hypothetical protein IQ22_02877 [Pseudomonas duriflava]
MPSGIEIPRYFYTVNGSFEKRFNGTFLTGHLHEGVKMASADFWYSLPPC